MTENNQIPFPWAEEPPEEDPLATHHRRAILCIGNQRLAVDISYRATRINPQPAPVIPMIPKTPDPGKPDKPGRRRRPR